jgi:uncharacterized protein (TIGR03086 family)
MSVLRATMLPTATQTEEVRTVTTPSDPRPLYRRSHAWVRSLLAEVSRAQLDLPTDCPEFDVRALVGHLVATVRKLTAIGRGGDPFSLPQVVTGMPDGALLAAYADAEREMWAVWNEDAVLATAVSAPFGSVPGATAMWGFLNEALVHGWELARATEQSPEADPEVVEPVLAVIEGLLPAEPRGGAFPFGPVVEPERDAGPTERLANWSGRQAGPR